MSRILIIEDSESARAAYAVLLRRAGLAQDCRVLSEDEWAQERGAADDAVDGRAVDGAADVVIRADMPVRAGAVLDKIVAQIRAASRDDEAVFVIGPYDLQVRDGVLVHRESGALVRLTDKEAHMLVFLAQQNGAVVDRRQLLGAVWEYADTVETHTLETHIYRLRQKIEGDPSQPEILLTEESGYRLVTPE